MLRCISIAKIISNTWDGIFQYQAFRAWNFTEAATSVASMVATPLKIYSKYCENSLGFSCKQIS